jgi:hypothetical protein
MVWKIASARIISITPCSCKELPVCGCCACCSYSSSRRCLKLAVRLVVPMRLYVWERHLELQPVIVQVGTMGTVGNRACNNYYFVIIQALAFRCENNKWLHGESCIGSLIMDELSLESFVTTDGQSASLSWNKKHPLGAYDQICYYCLTVAGLLLRCALSDKRTGLPFTIAACPRQRSHFRVRIPLDL